MEHDLGDYGVSSTKQGAVTIRLLCVSSRSLPIIIPPFPRSFSSVFFDASSKIVVANTNSLKGAFDWVAPGGKGCKTEGF
jgi:hypothetical protein